MNNNITLKYVFENEDKLDLTYDIQLHNFLTPYNGVNGFKFIGILMKNEVKNIEDDKFFCIVNYDKSSMKGSHWVGLIKDGKNLYHFGSFGIHPLQVIIKRFDLKKHNLYYNAYAIQKTNSNICGHLTVLFIKYMLENGVNSQSFDGFLTKAKRYSNRYRLDN